jgi:aryl-alcohol dehydrogenase-like predicted oxidoreductase
MNDDIKKQPLGKTGLLVTRLGYGAMELRGERVWDGRPVTVRQAENILNAVLDAGINFIDTSNDYGTSEQLIGTCISPRRREYYLATKCGCSILDKGNYDETPHIWTKENLLRNIETSLTRLKTDCVDLWQLHNPSPEQVQDSDLLDVMEQVKSQGKTRWIGVSTTLPHIRTFLEWNVFDVFQVPYSALQRQHEKMITAVAKAGAGTIIRGAVAQGELGVSYRALEDRWQIWEKANLDEFRGPNESRTAFMLRFTLTHPDLNTAIVGTFDPRHLAENLIAAKAGPLPADIYTKVKHRLDRFGN